MGFLPFILLLLVLLGLDLKVDHCLVDSVIWVFIKKVFHDQGFDVFVPFYPFLYVGFWDLVFC